MELTLHEALQQGIAAHKAGKLQDAERLYRAILQVQPNHPDANHNLGVLAVAVGKPLEAMPLFKQALGANPRIEQFWLSYLDVLTRLERFEEAERALIDAEQAGVASEKLELLRQQNSKHLPTDNKKNKRGLTVSEQRKRLATKKKDKNKKRKAQRDSSGKAPLQDQINTLLDHYNADRLAAAESLAESLTQQFPKHPFGWKALGAIFEQAGRLQESLLPGQKSIELSPHDAEAHYNLGASFQKLGMLDDAEAIYRKAVALKPNYANAHHNLGATLLNLGRLEDAEVSFRRAIALNSDFPEAHNSLGATLQDLGKIGEAEASYRNAIGLKPDYAEAHGNLGAILIDLDCLVEAEKSLIQAVALKPDNARTHNNLGAVLLKLNRLADAEVSFRQSLALQGDYAEAHSNLGTTLQKLDRLEDAIESYRQAVLLNPGAGYASHMLSALTGESTTRAPLDYVENLFDGYAANFDSSLVNQLDYQTPRVILDLIKQNNTDDNLGSVLDLGCGTGLFGIEVSGLCNRLEGLDISGNMLRKAEDRGLYDRLIKEDIESYLSNETLDFDYFVATDVFVYIGELADVFESIQSRNASGGRLAFSVEHKDGNDFALLPSGRYAHSKLYIEGLCSRFQYHLEHFETQNLRLDKGSYIRGGLYLLSF